MENLCNTQSVQTDPCVALTHRLKHRSTSNPRPMRYSRFFLAWEQLGDKPIAPVSTINTFSKLLKRPVFHAEHLSFECGRDVLDGMAVSCYQNVRQYWRVI